MDNPPGNLSGFYLLEVDEDNKLTLHSDNNTILPDFTFIATAGSESTFIFEIDFAGATFSQPPVIWVNPETDLDPPPSIVPSVTVDRTVLTLQVNPPNSLPEALRFHFRFNFEGANPTQGDPTIVEKPPVPPPPDDQE